MKSLSIKIPIAIAQTLDDRGELNPSFMAEFLLINMDYPVYDKVEGLCYNYTFKIDSALHKMIKLKAIELDLPINDFVARLLNEYYRGK